LIITTSPETLNIGSGMSKVVITVTNSHGTAYVNKTVAFAGSSGKTGTDGKVTLFATLNATGAQAVSVTTDGSNATKDITVVYTEPTTPKATVLSGAAVERKGDTLFVQVAKFEELGATKSWDSATKTATFICGGKTVVVHIGSTIAQVNGVNVTMPVAPYIVNGRTMVPTRFISENLGWTVDYAAGDIVTITLN
jgi:hypothetical protein